MAMTTRDLPVGKQLAPARLDVFFSLFTVEFRKQCFRPRTYVILGAMAVLPLLITMALLISGPGHPERVQALLVVPSSSGMTLWVIALASTEKFFIPLVIALFAGEAMTGEASWGSLRYILAGSNPRTTVLASKTAVAAILCVAAIATLCAASLVVGFLAFGFAPLSVTVAKTVSFTSAIGQFGGASTHVSLTSVPVAVEKMALAALYTGALSITIFSCALLASVISDKPIIAIATGAGLAVVSWTLQTDAIPGLKFFAPYTPTHGVGLWQWLLVSPVSTAGMAGFLVKQAIYSGIFLSVAFWWFGRKEIHS